jgi:formylglycine-generating enzyme required for sulfatase activity
MKTVFILLWLSVAQAQAPVPCPQAALTEAPVLQLIKDRVPDGRIVQFVGACHIGFFPASEILDRLSRAGATPPVLEALRQDGYPRATLADARQEVASLERRIQNLTTASDAARDRALAQLDADYQPQRDKAAQVSPKDMFEKEADYAARVAKAKGALAELERNHKAAREQMAARYARELAEQTQAIRRQIEAFVRERKYPVAGAKLDFVNYDADHDRLVAAVNGEEYWFTVPADRAKTIYGRWNNATLAQAFNDDDSHTRYLVDTPAYEHFPGLPKVVVKETERKEAAAARAAAEEIERKEAAARAAAVAAAEERRRTLYEQMANAFVAIPAGEFMMGSDSAGSDEKPRHRVRITKGFEMGKYEVTQAQWKTVMGSNPSYFKGDDRPVETVSWGEVQEFLKRLNATDDGYRYRLPTEAEWEYAARAGSTADAVANLDAVAWHRGNSGGETHPVGRKRANGWGLYDTSGNVWEWCADWYGADYYASSPVDDPPGPASGTLRVVRGGSWGDRLTRPANRVRYDPDVRYHDMGLRLVRVKI